MESYGSRGTMVELIQLCLQRAGYSPGRVDGIFGRETQRAVMRFQQSRGLVPDGIVGPQTWQRMVPYLKGYVRYSVQPGDNFYSIARRYSTTVDALRTANPGVNPQNLIVGSVITIPLGFDLVPENVHYTAELNRYITEGLAMRYPFLSRGSIGNSVMGKSIPYVKIGSGSVQVFYNASFHANEWLTTPVLLKFLEQYAKAYSNGSSIFGTEAAQLYKKATLFVVPMVNPDGVDLVNGVLNSGRYYQSALAMAQTYPQIPFPSGWKANISGVDLNLQYPANWQQARDLKFSQGFTRPGPRDYVGFAPLTAPESRAVYNFTVNRNFSIILAYHSQGELIYWKYLNYEPADSRRIADYFSEVSGYTVAETPYGSGFAGYKDWFIQNYNRPGYTIEVGRGVNPLPLSQFSAIYSDNLGILTGAITQI